MDNVANPFVALYALSLIVQLAAGTIALTSIRYVSKYKFGWVFLASGLLLMIGRRITPLLNHRINHIDAILSLIISSLLLVGVITIRKIVRDLQDKDTELKTLLQFDTLTKVFSRSEIINRGHLEVERAKRSNQPLGVLMIDIDHFKYVNDEHGHQAGDFVLANLAKHCSQTLREIDLLGRIGGEEFLVMLPNTDLESAKDVANRMRKHIESRKHHFENECVIQITVSIGVTCFYPENWQPEMNHAQIFTQLVKDADQAMYQAKKSGRNRAEVFLSCNPDA